MWSVKDIKDSSQLSFDVISLKDRCLELLAVPETTLAARSPGMIPLQPNSPTLSLSWCLHMLFPILHHPSHDFQALYWARNSLIYQRPPGAQEVKPQNRAEAFCSSKVYTDQKNREETEIKGEKNNQQRQTEISAPGNITIPNPVNRQV